MRRGEWTCQLGAALLVLAAAASGFVPNICAAKPKGGSFVVPDGLKFVDMLNKDIPTDDATDMQFRFLAGPRIRPLHAEIIDGTVMKPWVDDMSGIFDRFLNAYTLGPKPQLDSIPIYVVDDSDVNCVIQLEDSDDASKAENTSASGFLDVAQSKSTTPSTKIPDTIGASSSSNAQKPQRIELRCTELALEDMGDPSDPLKGRNEIAFVLAHELSHILLGHFKRAEAQLKRQQDLNKVFHLGATVLTLANSRYHVLGNTLYVTPTKQASKDVTKLFLATYIVNEYNVAIQGPKWARDQEEQADLMAIDLIHMLPPTDPHERIDDTGAADILNRLADTEMKVKAAEPSFGEQLATVMASEAIQDATSNQSGKNIISAMSTKAAVFAYLKWREGAVQHIHDNSAVRGVAIGNYINSRYPVTADSVDFAKYDVAGVQTRAPSQHFPDPAKLKSGSWDGQAFKAAALPQVQARRLLDQLATGNCDALDPDLTAFVADERNKTVRTQQESYALGMYDICETKWDDAIPLFRAAAQGPQAKSSFYLSLIQTEQFRNRDADALADIDEAETRAPPKNQYLSLKISSLMAMKRTDEAKAAAKDCKANQDQDLGSACMAAAGFTYDGQPLPPQSKAAESAPVTDSSSPAKDNSAVNFLKNLVGGSKTAASTTSSGS